MAAPPPYLTIVAGDAVVRSDEELALSVLRYGKVLSRKLENRMQVKLLSRDLSDIHYRLDQRGALAAACTLTDHSASAVFKNCQ